MLDIPRNLSFAEGNYTGFASDPTVEMALAWQDRGVVALGLGGNEVGAPPEPFAHAFDAARAGGLHSVPHAGEMAGPESVWGAIRALGAERIGHGVRSIEDPDLVDYLVQQQIPLEVNPTSNLCLGVYPSYEAHPLRRLWDAGAYVTVNSDDPPLFNTTLNQEYRVLIDHFGFDADMLEQITLNALRASFLPAAKKDAMEKNFSLPLPFLRAEHDVEFDQSRTRPRKPVNRVIACPQVTGISGLLEFTRFPFPMIPIHFIGERIEVQFDVAPTFSKTPGCPAGFIWQDETYRITELLTRVA